MRVAVLGCSGAIGSFFVKYFLAQGHVVTGSDRRRRRGLPAGIRFAVSNAEAVRGAEIVLVAVPIDETVNVVREVLPFVRQGATLIEMTSVKGNIPVQLAKLLAMKKVSLLSLHPLFGPLAQMTNLNICVIGNKRDLAAARRIFPRTRLFQLRATDHDKLMAYTLSLVHLTNAAIVSTLAKEVGVERFQRSAPPLASAQLNLGRAVLSQSPALLARIQADNPFAAEALSSVIAELEDLKRAVAKKDIVDLEKRFATLAENFTRTELDEALRSLYPPPSA